VAEDAIVVEGVTKRFGAVHALTGVDLRVPRGRVLGLLGPNGAGKTTVVRILTTLLRPDEGRAEVAGHDVSSDPRGVRRAIGLAGQNAAVDENLTGRENLEMVARLYHLGRREARRRARELLTEFELSDAAERPMRGYSGGMRRRLDLAASLVGRPAVVFLDEPTTGLDPPSRRGLWELVEGLVGGGTTVLLTTQYLEEADRLADDIAVIDGGRVIAEGTAAELKTRVGGERLELKLSDHAQVDVAARALAGLGKGEARGGADGRLVLGVEPESGLLAEAVRRLDGVGVGIDDLGYRRPTLDDVFDALTGSGADGGEPDVVPRETDAASAEATAGGGPAPEPEREAA
jgi:ABC-2 type transport system ATP-binding protein